MKRSSLPVSGHLDTSGLGADPLGFGASPPPKSSPFFCRDNACTATRAHRSGARSLGDSALSASSVAANALRQGT